MSKRTKKGRRTRRRTSRSRRRKKKGGANYLQYLKARYMFNTLAWRFIDKDRMETILENLGIPDDEGHFRKCDAGRQIQITMISSTLMNSKWYMITPASLQSGS